MYGRPIYSLHNTPVVRLRLSPRSQVTLVTEQQQLPIRSDVTVVTKQPQLPLRSHVTVVAQQQ